MNRRGMPALLLLGCAMLTAGCSAPLQERRYRQFFAATAAALVPDYRLPPESAYGPLWAAVESTNWRTRDGTGMTKAEFWTSGDFNGDGRTDYAYVLTRADDGERALYAFLSTASGHEALAVVTGIAPRTWVETRGPGRYATAAAAGAGPDSADAAPDEFELAADGIVLFRYESASSTFVWNSATGAFERFRTSD